MAEESDRQAETRAVVDADQMKKVNPVHYLLFIFAFLWFAFIAPVHVTLGLCISLLLVTAVVKATAYAFVGAATYGEAFKSVCLAFVSLVIASFTLYSFLAGAGMPNLKHIPAVLQRIPAVLITGALFVAYVLGFKFGMQANFGASVAIAVGSTVVSGGLLYGLLYLVA